MRVLHVAGPVVAQPRRPAVLAERVRRAQRRRVQLVIRQVVVRVPGRRICRQNAQRVSAGKSITAWRNLATKWDSG